MDFLVFVVENEEILHRPAGIVAFLPILLVLCVSVLPCGSGAAAINAGFGSHSGNFRVWAEGDFGVGVGWTIRIEIDAGNFAIDIVFDGNGIGNQTNTFNEPIKPVAFGDASGHWLGCDWRGFGGVEDFGIDGKETGDGNDDCGGYGNGCRFLVASVGLCFGFLHFGLSSD